MGSFTPIRPIFDLSGEFVEQSPEHAIAHIAGNAPDLAPAIHDDEGRRVSHRPLQDDIALARKVGIHAPQRQQPRFLGLIVDLADVVIPSPARWASIPLEHHEFGRTSDLARKQAGQQREQPNEWDFPAQTGQHMPYIHEFAYLSNGRVLGNTSISLVAAAGAGFLSFLSPCVLPLVPPYLCFIAGVSLDELPKRASGEAARNWLVPTSALAFVLGFSTVFVALGASASFIGRWVADQFDLLSLVAGGLLMILGLHYLGAFRIGLLFREARLWPDNRPAGLAGAYAVGLAFAFGWTPCVGPVLAAILMVAGVESSAQHGALLLGAYALGLGVPFLLASLLFSRFAGLVLALRNHLATVEKVTGAGLLITGVAFLTGGMPKIAGWLLKTFPGLASVG